jgi:hypothetical protein
MLETIHSEIETLSPEAQELLLDFIHLLKKRYTVKEKSQPKSLYQQFQEQGLIGCFEDDENVSTNYKQFLTESLEKKYGYR